MNTHFSFIFYTLLFFCFFFESLCLGAFYIPLLVMLVLYYKIYEAAKRVVEAELKSQASCNSVQPLAFPATSCSAAKSTFASSNDAQLSSLTTKPKCTLTTKASASLSRLTSDRQCLRCERTLTSQSGNVWLRNRRSKSPDQMSEPSATPLLRRRDEFGAETQTKHTTSLPMMDSDVDTQWPAEANNNRLDQLDHCRSLESNDHHLLTMKEEQRNATSSEANRESRTEIVQKSIDEFGQSVFQNRILVSESRLSQTLGSIKQTSNDQRRQLLQLRFNTLCDKCSQSNVIEAVATIRAPAHEHQSDPDRCTKNSHLLPLPDAMGDHAPSAEATSPTLSTNAALVSANRRLHSSLRERKASITLGVIMCAFIFCWLPFFILALMRPFVSERIPDWASSVSLWLGYVNSMLNPIIYVTFHQDFRRAFKYILLCRCKAMKSSMRKEAYHVQYGWSGVQSTVSTINLKTICKKFVCLTFIFECAKQKD